MSKIKGEIDMRRRSDALTPDLFDIPQAPTPIGGSLDYASELSHVLAEALKKSPKSRYEIAGRMSELVGHEISKASSTPSDAWCRRATPSCST